MDGVLGAWIGKCRQRAIPLWSYTQQQHPAKKETVAYITYDNLHLYIAKAYDMPENIRASIRPRDDFKMLERRYDLCGSRSIYRWQKQPPIGYQPVGSQLDTGG